MTPEPAHHLALFEASPTPMLLVDHVAGVIVEANPAAALFYGYALQAMHGMPVTNLSEQAQLRLNQVARNKTGALSFTTDHRLASGQVRRVEIGSSLVEVEGRRLVYSVIRPAAEVADERAIADLRESERRYRELVERLGAGVVQFDGDGRPTWANETMATMLGYTRDELLAVGTGAIVDETVVSRGDVLRGLAQAGSIALDVALRHRDGRALTVELCARRLPDGTIEAVVHDVTAQREAGAEVAASEERYRLLVEQAFDGIVVIGPDRRIQHINPTACAILGVGPDDPGILEALERGGDRGQGTDDRASERQRLLEGEEVVGFGTVTRADGGVVRIEQRARLRPDGSTVAVLRDVTAAKAAQEALERSEARIRELVESMDDLVVVYGPDGRITYVNPAVIRETGLPAGDLIGHDTAEYVEGPDLERHLADRAAVLAGGGPSQREMRFRCADGTRLWLEARTHRMANGNAECIARVITDRKALQAERDRLALALDQSTDIVVLTDLQGVTQYVNRAFEQTYGLSRAATIGADATTWFAMMPETQPPDGIFGVLQETGYWHGDVLQRRPDGTRFTASARLALVRDQDGEPIGYLGIASDVTRERALAERMAEAAKNEAVGQLAGGIAHDFNNLLTAVLGYAELAATTPPGDPALAEDLGEILDAARRAQALTRQLLAFARRSILLPRVLDPVSAVHAVEPALRQLAGGAVQLEVRSEAGVGSVRVDPALLEHALVGLVENAREAMPDGGRIGIGIGTPVPEDDPPPGDWAVIRVEDSGRGMSAETRGRALEPFFSFKQVSGAGFGLPVVSGFVVQSGGHLRIRTAPGQGTVVSLLLPIETGGAAATRSDLAVPPAVQAPEAAPATAPPAVQAPEAAPATAPPAGSERVAGTEPATVLIVDDEAVLRTIAERVMGMAGHRVLVAASGEEALEVAARAGRIDLLFTDIVMPGMHGIALAAALRAARPGLHVLVTSGYTPDDVDRRGVGLAEMPFLPKPYTPAELTRTVAGLLATDPEG